MKAWVARAAREWPLGIAIAGLVSLLFLPRIARFDAFRADAARRDLDELRRAVDSGEAAAAEPRLTAYLARRPEPALAAEAGVLLARAGLGRAKTGDFPGAAALARAWAVPELRREAATFELEYGLLREAVDHFRVLADESRDPELALNLAAALIRRAATEPGLRNALLDEASRRVSDVLHGAPAERRVRGILAKARIFRESKRDAEILPVLAAELAEAREPADRGLLHLERGRAFARLGRNMEAMASFDEAERLLADPLLRGTAVVQLAELFAREGKTTCLEFCNRVVAAESPAAPLALLVAGAFDLNVHPTAGLDALRNGFAQIRRPRLLDDAGLDLSWVRGVLRAAAEREGAQDRLLRFAAVYAELGRLEPLSARVGFEHAALLLRAGSHEEAANRFLAVGAFSPDDRERALEAAADACADGGLHLRAAALYGDLVELQPSGHAAALFRRALSLKKAGDAEGAMAGFELYLTKAGAGGSFSGSALLEKAAVLASLDRWEDSLATCDRILQAREIATSPARDDWAQALLGRGRALLHLTRFAEARKTLAEYLERYAEGPVPAPASIEAAWLLVGASIGERQWKAGLARLRELDALAAKLPESDRAPYAGLLREARFTEGDLLYNLEDYASAFRVYGEAFRRTTGAEDRLWGLIGRARALARLERKDEARRDYASARAIVDEGSLAGRGRDYWEIALASLAKEVQ